MSNPQISFGASFRKKYFTSFDENLVNLNHGSFGATTTEILDQKTATVKELASFPDVFYRKTLSNSVVKCRELISEFVNCDFDDLVFLGNATTAVNAVLRSYPFKENDVIINFSVNFHACKNTIDFVVTEKKMRRIEIPITFPISDMEIVSKMEKVIDGLLPKPENQVIMVFMDAVCSMPGLKFPWELLVKICREKNILSFVDAAHQIGIRDIDMKRDKPNFFTSNLHKWLYVPNSVAFLYVDPMHHSVVKPLPISNVYNSTKFADQFNIMSTLDYSSLTTIPAALKFRNEVCGGEKSIMLYHSKLAKDAINLILKEWPNSELLDSLDRVTTMFNIILPLENQKHDTSKFVGFAMDFNMNTCDKKTYIPLFIYNNQLVSRWSVAIYLELADFQWGIQQIKKAYAVFDEAEK